MLTVNFVLADGERHSVQIQPGETLLDAALDNNVPGIHGQCGGGCTCCTCHCYVGAPWFDRAESPHQDELDMLEYAWQRSEASRLACQVKLTTVEDFDGIEVKIPAQQS